MPMDSEHYDRLEKYHMLSPRVDGEIKRPTITSNRYRLGKNATRSDFDSADRSYETEEIYDTLSSSSGRGHSHGNQQKSAENSYLVAKVPTYSQSIKNSRHAAAKPALAHRQQANVINREEKNPERQPSFKASFPEGTRGKRSSNFARYHCDQMADIEHLYAKPVKPKQNQQMSSNRGTKAKRGSLLSKIKRVSLTNSVKERSRTASKSESAGSAAVYGQKRQLIRKESLRRETPLGGSLLGTKDNNELVRHMQRAGLQKEAASFAAALKKRFHLEEEFIKVCAKDGVKIVEGDHDDDLQPHRSIGGLKVYGLRKRNIMYDEYDPNILSKFSDVDKDDERAEIAREAANLRREAAELMWDVGNLERLLDKNSRVHYVSYSRNGAN